MKKQLISLTICGLLASQTTSAHDENHKLHFEHPLVAESPSPDTKLRFDYIYQNKPSEDEESKSSKTTLRLEGEYAFNRSLSIEVDIPYTFLNPEGENNTNRLDNAQIGLKYANYSFEDKGLLLGGGLEFGLPTGNAKENIGSNHVVEIAPFLDFGYQHKQLQIIGFAEFGFPVNDNSNDIADFELGWNLAFIYTGLGNFKPLFELDGEKVNGGEEDGFNSVNLTTGFKYSWPGNEALQIGAGISFPVTNDKEFYAKPIISVFYHF